MKKGIYITLLVIGGFIGLAVFFYPSISSFVNSRNQSSIVKSYIEEVENYDNEKIKSLLSEARIYNESLLNKQNRFILKDEEFKEYRKLINTGRDVMGVLIIEKIDIRLPIYHGASESVLQAGLGHLPGSSLPVGGVGTHSVIMGHRGLPSSTLLTHLDKMTEGDYFEIYILGEVISYQVDMIRIVKPDEIKALNIDKNMDYCTLVTCTPYGINSHRLLVRGHRVENGRGNKEVVKTGDAHLVGKIQMVIMTFLLATILLIPYIFLRCKTIHKGG